MDNLKITCPECEGEKQVFAGNKPGFNVSTMEVFADDIYENCSTCEGEGEVQNVSCIECGEDLRECEQKRETRMCSDCDGECHCRSCEESK